MDLAKIRQKARQERENSFKSNVMQTTESESAITEQCSELDRSLQTVEETDLWDNIEALISSGPFTAIHNGLLPSHRILRDPLSVILAGRESAGFDDQQPNDVEIKSQPDNNFMELLCFRVSDEIYGINIMDIKEIIKPQKVTEVPHAPSCVSGIISMRGMIIPVIDMLNRLGLERDGESKHERVIIVRHGTSYSGLLVDEVIQVVRIPQDFIDEAPNVLDGIDRDFVTGIGRAEGQMIILLNLNNITDIHLT